MLPFPRRVIFSEPTFESKSGSQKIEVKRAISETWLGKAPESKEEAEWEMPLAGEHL
jgi:hypothetical protein